MTDKQIIAAAREYVASRGTTAQPRAYDLARLVVQLADELDAADALAEVIVQSRAELTLPIDGDDADGWTDWACTVLKNVGAYEFRRRHGEAVFASPAADPPDRHPV